MTSVDVDYRFGYKYAEIDKAVTIDRKKLYGENVEPTGFARVRKKNGKYNYVEIKSEEEISPIDFEYATSINPKTGLFKITYNGEEYDACIYGFFVNEEELEAFDGHSFDELKLLDENIMKQQNVIRLTESQLRDMIKESLKDIFNKFGGNKEEGTIDKRTQGFVESIISKILFTASGDMSNPTEGDYLYKEHYSPNYSFANSMH
jgi:hypothetical protein